MTPSDLDEIRKRREAACQHPDDGTVKYINLIAWCSECGALRFDKSGETCTIIGEWRVPPATKALLDEVDRLNRYIAQNNDEYRVMKDVLHAEHQACQELREQVERLQRENADRRRRPPMSCTACEDHNQELADKNRDLEFENAELRDAISDDAAATLADRNEIRKYMGEILDALVFASDPIDMNAFTLGYKDAAARVEALADEVRRLRATLAAEVK